MGMKELFVKWGIPAVGAYLAFAPATMPLVKQFAVHQPFGYGMLAAWAAGYFLMRK